PASPVPGPEIARDQVGVTIRAGWREIGLARQRAPDRDARAGLAALATRPLWSFRPAWPHQSLRTAWSFRALHALRPDRSGMALRALRATRPLRPDVAARDREREDAVLCRAALRDRGARSLRPG